jgi:predicted O-methyltransferase YrrM
LPEDVTMKTSDDLRIHAEMAAGGRVTTFGLDPRVLEWIPTVTQRGSRTLETGSGLSTLAFAEAGANHVAITPMASEQDAIERAAADRGLDLSTTRFIIGYSEDVLPTLEWYDLDVALIDGDHRFPQVFIDWHYAARRLKVGGLVVVDDLNLWTGSTLAAFLDAEPAWERAVEWPGRAAAYRKIGATDPDWSSGWRDQPFVAARSSSSPGRSELKARLRRGQLAPATRMLVERAKRGLSS